MAQVSGRTSVLKQIQAALRESEAKFEILAEMTVSSIFIFRGTRIKYVNPATKLLTGCSQQELLGTNFYDLFSPEEKINRIQSPGHEFLFIDRQ